jgi:hypothetical protein
VAAAATDVLRHGGAKIVPVGITGEIALLTHETGASVAPQSGFKVQRAGGVIRTSVHAASAQNCWEPEA